MCLIKKGISLGKITRIGRKVVLVHIISISKEMIGIGRLNKPSETSGTITETPQGKTEV
jgi:hypothetical protein